MKTQLTGDRTAGACAVSALSPQHHQMNDTTARRKSWLSFGLYSRDSKMHSAKLKYSWFCKTIRKLKQKCNYHLLAKCSVFKYMDGNEVPNYPFEFCRQEGTCTYSGSKNSKKIDNWLCRNGKGNAEDKYGAHIWHLRQWKTSHREDFWISVKHNYVTEKQIIEFIILCRIENWLLNNVSNTNLEFKDVSS